MAFNAIARDGGTGPMGTKEEFMELFDGVVAETENGVGLGMDIMVVVGKKPE